MSDHGPIKRVEFHYADGTIQRLSGPPAEAWLDDVNSVIAAAHVRYSRTPIENYPWEWLTDPHASDEPDERVD